MPDCHDVDQPDRAGADPGCRKRRCRRGYHGERLQAKPFRLYSTRHPQQDPGVGARAANVARETAVPRGATCPAGVPGADCPPGQQLLGSRAKEPRCVRTRAVLVQQHALCHHTVSRPEATYPCGVHHGAPISPARLLTTHQRYAFPRHVTRWPRYVTCRSPRLLPPAERLEGKDPRMPTHRHPA